MLYKKLSGPIGSCCRHNMRYGLMFFLLLFPLHWKYLHAQPSHQWSFGVGGIGNDWGQSIAVDGSGNVYITGIVSETTDFDPGPGIVNIVPAQSGFAVICVAKYNSAGTYQWAFGIGSANNNDWGEDIFVDASGNVYVTGFFSGTADFNPGAGIANLTSSGGTSDIFVAKYNSAGVYQWAIAMGGGSSDYGKSIAVDGSGNVYITGEFAWSGDFDPGAGVFTLNGAGGTDIFLAKYNNAGTLLWAFNLGSTNFESGYEVAVDGSGNAYITGYIYVNAVDFDPGPGTAILTPASAAEDIFVAKYNSAGAYQWAFNIGGSSSDFGDGIAVDASGNVYIAGFFSSASDFDPGPGTVTLTPAMSYDLYVAKYNTSGVYQWAFNIGGTNTEEGWGIAVDGCGSVYVTGEFVGTADFDPGPGTANVTYVGSGWNADVFFAKYSTSGTYQWAFNIGSNAPGGDEWGKAIAVDASNVYLTGRLQNTADFDPGSGTANHTSVGAMDIYVAKYSKCSINPFAVNTTQTNISCNGATNGSATATPGGGSTPYTYQWSPGGGSTSAATGLGAGTYSVNITDACGCSNTQTVAITQPPAPSASLSVTPSGCGGNNGSASVTASGGTPGYTYSWSPSGGNSSAATGLSAGNYTCTITDANNCTQTAAVAVAQTGSPAVTTSVTPQTCTQGGIAYASPSGGTAPYTYQWCNGATTSATTGLSAGSCTVTVTDANGCVTVSSATITTSGNIPSVSTASSPASCGNNNGSAAANASGGTSPYSYNWNNGQTAQTATGLGTGTYTVTVTDANGCTQTQTASVTSAANTVSVTAGSTPAGCATATGTATANAGGGASPYSYLWNNGQTAQTATGLAAGNYTVIVTDANGCTQTQTVTVTSNNTLTLNTSSTQTGCTVNNGTAAANPSGGTAPYTYAWSNGQTISTATGLGMGNYSVTITDASGCVQTQTVSIAQISGPIAAVAAVSANITIGGNTQLTATGGGTYSWSPATGLNCTTCANPVAAPSQTTAYCVIVTDGNGCTDNACITINVEIPCGNLFIPTAFSPNNDGQNELECVLGGCIKTLHFAIYDRWGEKVFEYSGSPLPSGGAGGGPCWDGMYKGKLMNTAAFAYYLQATLNNGEQINKKGNISLIR